MFGDAAVHGVRLQRLREIESRESIKMSRWSEEWNSRVFVVADRVVKWGIYIQGLNLSTQDMPEPWVKR
jgi:hypothetical protein